MAGINRRFFLVVAILFVSLSARADYLPRAEAVADNVYAIVGPLGQRSAENDGLNANYGFIVTSAGVVLIDSGASLIGAKKLERAIRAVTDQPIRWVINTGSQDHRWLGIDHFARQGARIIALRRTAEMQEKNARQQIENLRRFLGERLAGTVAMIGPQPLADGASRLELGGEVIELVYTDAHYSGDLVYVDRLMGILPGSSVSNGRKAFHALAALKPARIVPGHGRVCDLAQAQRESGDYYEFLAERVGAAAKEMESMDEVLKRHADLPAFRHLENYDSLHRANMNRAFIEFEGQ